MRIHHSAPYDPAGLVNHTHRRLLETNVQSCKHPHRCSPSFARGITSGKGRLPAGEQQPHVWDVLHHSPMILSLLLGCYRPLLLLAAHCSATRLAARRVSPSTYGFLVVSSRWA